MDNQRAYYILLHEVREAHSANRCACDDPEFQRDEAEHLRALISVARKLLARLTEAHNA